MHTLGLRSLSLAAAGAAALATLQCNAVLGIEEAAYDPNFVIGASGSSASGMGGTAGTSSATGGSGGTGTAPTYTPTHLPIGCIEPVGGCADCLGRCTAFDEAQCFASATCRRALDDYRVCLGDACSGAERCREELFLSAEANVTNLVTCLGECRTACGEKPLYTQCELYCACMDHNCTSSLGATGDACVAQCVAGATADPGIAYCRKSHCEFAALPGADSVIHCEHAQGLGACTAPPPDVVNCDRVFPGFPCERASDCCSNDCVGEICR